MFRKKVENMKTVEKNAWNGGSKKKETEQENERTRNDYAKSRSKNMTPEFI